MRPWYSITTLESGLPVLVALTASPSVSVVLMVKTGSKDETSSQAGISHFLEHFVFKGTRKYSTSREVMRIIDSIGADHNASTGKEATTYWAKTSAGQVERAMEVISEIVLHPTLPEHLLAKEKGVILQELAMYEDLPMSKVGDLFEGLIFGPKTSLGRPIIGWKRTINGLSRDDLVSYLAQRYRVERMVLGIAGGVQDIEVLRYASRYFDDIEKPLPVSHSSGPDVAIPSRNRARLVERRDTDQVHLVIGLQAIRRRDPRRYALGVLSTILGGNTSSQLFELVRERRGLAYYVRSTVSRYEQAGYLAVRAGVPPTRAHEVMHMVSTHLRQFSLSNQELDDAKGYLRGQLALDWEDSQVVAEHLVEDYLFEQHLRSREEIDRGIASVSRQDVEELADTLLREQLTPLVAAIGPVGESLKYSRPRIKTEYKAKKRVI